MPCIDIIITIIIMMWSSYTARFHLTREQIQARWKGAPHSANRCVCVYRFCVFDKNAFYLIEKKHIHAV